MKKTKLEIRNRRKNAQGDNMKVKSVLAIGAHPDDPESMCGGTLALYAKKGIKTSICYVTDGSAGHDRLTKEELKVVRKKESHAAAKVIGADVYWMGLPDALLFKEKDLEFALVDVIRKAKPDVIISHNSISEFHPDHVAVNKAVFIAAPISSLSNVRTTTPALAKTPIVYEMDAWLTRSFIPQEYVDISSVWKTKVKMLEAHKCQIDWMRRRDKLDMVTFIGMKSKLAGYQSGVKYAECFRLATNMNVVKPYRLLP